MRYFMSNGKRNFLISFWAIFGLNAKQAGLICLYSQRFFCGFFSYDSSSSRLFISLSSTYCCRAPLNHALLLRTRNLSSISTTFTDVGSKPYSFIIFSNFIATIGDKLTLQVVVLFGFFNNAIPLLTLSRRSRAAKRHAREVVSILYDWHNIFCAASSLPDR